MSRKKMVFFFSYSSGDRKAVSRVADELRKLGNTVWMDVSDMPAGGDISERLANAILKEVHFFVAFLVKRGARTKWVPYEQRLAIDRDPANNGFVIPVKLDKTRPIPSRLRGLSYLLAAGSRNKDMADLAARIDKAAKRQAKRKPKKRWRGPAKRASENIQAAKDPRERKSAFKRFMKRADSAEKFIGDLSQPSTPLNTVAKQLAQCLEAWGVVVLHRDKVKGWRVLSLKGLGKQFLAEAGSFVREFIPSDALAAGELAHQRHKTVVPVGRSAVVQCDSQLWVPLETQKRVLGVIGAYCSSSRGKGEFDTLDRRTLEQSAAVIVGRLATNPQIFNAALPLK